VWRDVLKHKYTQLVPQNGSVTAIPVECQIAMISVKLTQGCEEEQLQLLLACASVHVPHIFELQDIDDDIPGLSTIQFLPGSSWSHHGGVCHVGYIGGTNCLLCSIWHRKGCLPQMFCVWIGCWHKYNSCLRYLTGTR
jgi:hypothetical protein